MTDESPVYLANEDDAELNAAAAKSRQTFRYFWRELAWEYRRIIPGLDLACVKVAFSDPPETANPETPNVEQMWVSDVQFDGLAVSGTLLNSPNWLTSVREGDDVSVKPSEVNDWMYVIGGVVYGGYTVNQMRQKMGNSERKQHDAAWGFDFGDPKQIRLVPVDFVAGKSKPGFFARLFGAKEQIVTAQEAAQHEHPMSENMGDGLDEAVKSDPEMLTGTNDYGYNMLHQLALAGSVKGVTVMLKHGADPNTPAKNGATPLRLAKSLGWKKVVALLEQAGATA